ncbi:hypothetical protein COV18_00845 [Candidatus Woesearchaeota archaeon CG10_big_fil_rev_8_21_14_0_10_37_12]|nr:MAG: hypothetical protein COV18_00845 [Candidatus Woesearchaeota archaeon CG10_big_fil_rev_8_21_14_0_10_37_12]
MKKHQVKIVESIQETPNVKRVRLSKPDNFNFLPGQWIGVCCADFHENGTSRPLRRAFSIASFTDEPFIELCVARGKALSAHLQDLSVGSEVIIDGPFGLFWLKPAEKYLFIAGGTGIAPFMPMIKQALDEKKKITLIYSVKTEADVIYADKLDEFENDGNFKLVLTFTYDSCSDLAHEHKRVPVFLNKYYEQEQQAYVCGPDAFVDDVKEKLIDLGQEEKKIFVDKWD